MSHAPLATVPTGPVDVPQRVRELADGDDIRAVWINQLDGVTFRLTAEAGTSRYVKWVAAGTPELDLTAESERLVWASRWVAVPRVLASGSDEAGSWLVTAGINATSAVDPRWVAEPATAARAIGRGLRILHGSLPVDDCPFDWSAASRMATAGIQFDDPPSIDRLVVCHGDACAPNTLLDSAGGFAAHVDFGLLGVADRWADLAVASWSTEWNYGRGFTDILYDAYGIEPDAERIDYYRRLWDAT